MTLTVLEAAYRVEHVCELPPYLGSTLRGAFGHELRAVSCLEMDSPCMVCTRRDRCAAGALFDDPPAGVTSPAVPTEAEDRHADSECGSGGFAALRPYLLDVPPRRQGAYAPMETIRLGVTLVGRGRTWYPWVIAALAGVGHRGLSVHRHPLSLARLETMGPAGARFSIDPETLGIGVPTGPSRSGDRHLIHSSPAPWSSRPIPPELSGAGIVGEGPPPSPEALVTLVTPVDIKQKGRRLDRIDGPAFFRRLIRRVGTLVETYCSPPPQAEVCDYRALSAMADLVKVRDQSIHTEIWERYSSRLEAKHPLGGLVGHVLFTGISEPLWPYLVLGQRVHLGKRASFGLGLYSLMPQAERS